MLRRLRHKPKGGVDGSHPPKAERGLQILNGFDVYTTTRGPALASVGTFPDLR